MIAQPSDLRNPNAKKMRMRSAHLQRPHEKRNAGTGRCPVPALPMFRAAPVWRADPRRAGPDDYQV
jgi:hypothetical protein